MCDTGDDSGPARVTLGETELTVAPLDESADSEDAGVERFGQLLGKNARMRELFSDLRSLSASDVSILIEGETGTGKELLAEAVHQHSPRARAPFVVFDCSAAVTSHAESDLFGKMRSASDAAVQATMGAFEQAHGGTLFLDDVADLPMELQAKLLRILEGREVSSVSASRPDVRVLAASSRSLGVEMQSGRFRNDLYFRIAVAHVKIPPLRERVDDLPVLVRHFMSRLSTPSDQAPVSEHVWELLLSHPWPGNVRELESAVQRLKLMPDRALSELDEQPEALPFRRVLPMRKARREAVDSFEKKYLKFVLSRCDGNVTRAAAAVEISRQMYHKLLRKHGIE